MGRNARKRISYVLPLANSAGGHRLGVNGLAVDRQSSVLYSAGRDGVICAWDLHLDLRSSSIEDKPKPKPAPPPTTFRQQVQAHSHWVNDIVLANDSSALVSASSDITVKLWRPSAADPLPPQTIGLHTDYVKRVASPGQHEHWVASGGLDRKISLWDLNGAGKKLEISVGEDENTAKGSVYALAAIPNLIASGGPENFVRVWDSNTGKRIVKFVGHTDIVRDILIADDGDTILSASSDQTVKVWSMTGGRCMYTLTMHNDSVWSLFSPCPQLSVFYSSDRSGMVAKSDVRNCAELDEGLSIAICHENKGVSRLVAAGDYIWTATSSSSINRWNDVQLLTDVDLLEPCRRQRSSVSTLRAQYPSPSSVTSPTNGAISKIPFNAFLRMSNAALYPQAIATKDPDASTLASTRKPSESMMASEGGAVVPCQSLPDFCIGGQNGLIKHHLLNDRRRVLTLDTTSEVLLWDLLQCAPIRSFGKKPIDDVMPEVQTRESIAHWCAVDTRIGTLTCVLEENYCFDAEIYADELALDEQIELGEDHRINLGKWVLRFLFANLIDEEIERDAHFRATLQKGGHKNVKTSKRPANIQLPSAALNAWKDPHAGPTTDTTLKANQVMHVSQTPGLAIGLATPMGPPPSSAGRGSQHNSSLTSNTDESSQLERVPTRPSSTQESADYFSQRASFSNGNGMGKSTETKEDAADAKDEPLASPTESDAPAKRGKGVFGKKFNMSFNMKKFGTGTTVPEPARPAVVDDKAEDSDSRSTKTDEKTLEDNFYGCIQKIRRGYEEQLATTGKLDSLITPSLPDDTPVLKLPASTTILIQEDRPEAGGVADLFEGKVGSLGFQADLIESVAPMWLAEVLLRNQLPAKDMVKVSFILEPFQNSLPSLSSDGNNRLNANRMLRARKILGYIAERIEPAPTKEEVEAAEHDGSLMKPEEYLELYCNGQLVPTMMTLASIRAHIWRGAGDVLLYYKANGRKEIKHTPYAGPQTGSPPPPGYNPLVGVALGLSQASSNASERKASSEAERSSQQSGRGHA